MMDSFLGFVISNHDGCVIAWGIYDGDILHKQHRQHYGFEGRYGLVDKTHPPCVRTGFNTWMQH